jgi:hypothetical protein
LEYLLFTAAGSNCNRILCRINRGLAKNLYFSVLLLTVKNHICVKKLFRMKKQLLVLLFLCTGGLLLRAQLSTFNVESATLSYSITLLRNAVKHTPDNGSLSCMSYMTNNTTVPTFNIYVKRDSAGAVEWSERLDFNTLVSELSNIITCGTNGYMDLSVGYKPNIVLGHYLGVRTDVNGNLKWNTRYIPQTTQYRLGSTPAFLQTSDGGFILVSTFTDLNVTPNHFGFHALRIDSLGNIRWSKGYALAKEEIALYNMDLCSNGDIIMCGSRKNLDCTTFLNILRIDSNGTLRWTKEYHHQVGSSIYPYAIRETANSDFVLFGYDSNPQGSFNLIIRLDNAGQPLWSNLYNFGPDFYKGKNMLLTPDGGIVINGCAVSNATSTLYGVAMKTDSAGAVQWCRQYDGLWEPDADLTATGGFLFSGINYNGELLIRTDASGMASCPSAPVNVTVLQSSYTIAGDTVSQLVPVITEDGPVTIAPFFVPNTMPCGFSVGITETGDTPELTVYPNPATAQVSLLHAPAEYKLVVFNSSGQLLYAGTPEQNTLQVQHWPDGVYLFRIESGEHVITQKVMIGN